MKVLITAVGQRTEHWTDLFGLFARQPDLDLTLLLADISPGTELTLRRYSQQLAGFRYQVLRHLLGEARSGHMASILFAPGALKSPVAGGPDVIHIIGEAAYLSTAQVITWRNRQWPGVPLTLYAAQNVVTRFPRPFPWFEHRAYDGIDHAFPITPAALHVLRQKGYRGDAQIVPLGVDTARFRPPEHPRAPHRFTIGFVGRLEPHKGIADLLEAVVRLDADLLVVGRGSLTPMVRQLVERRRGRARLVEWADHQELPRLMHQMDVLALPSVEVVQRNLVPWVGIPLREQFGRVLVEAMACGVPVVGSDVGEIDHVTGAGGLTFPAGNVDALTAALRCVRDDEVLARRLGRNAAARARSEFSWARSASLMRAVWEQLAGSPPAPVAPGPQRAACLPAAPAGTKVGRP